MDLVCTSDHWVQHAYGRIFARQWQPAMATATGAPIVMLHDSLGCADLWRGFPEALCASTGRRVIAYDRLGFGQSDARAEPPPLDFIEEEARRYFPALRDQLGVDRFVALGHSVGGGMAIQFAAQASDACEALVTIAAQVFVEARTLDGIRAARAQFKSPDQIDRLSKYHGAKSRWVLDAWIDTWLDPRFADWTLEPVLPRVTCPVLALHGELDEYGSPAHPALIGRLCAGPAQVDILAGVGHVPHREAAARVGSQISGFLQGIDR